MELWNSISGMVTVELTGADVTKSLDILCKAEIDVYATQILDPLRVRFDISRASYKRVKSILEKRGDKIVLYKRRGIYWSIYNFLHRPVFLFGLALIVISALYVPGHIFFIQVEGNQNLTDVGILSAAEECGVYFGVPANVIRSEKVKNQLMDRLPQLQWVGVNTRGCVAVIQVLERDTAPETQTAADYTDIVATRDGIIRECTVQRGSAVCRVGQAVSKGDMLISGMTDCGLVLKHTGAEGEILAETRWEFSVIIPHGSDRKSDPIKVDREYGLRIGKNIVKFSKDSGISGSSCGKMYEEKSIELPGGFCLPVALVCQTTYYYEPQPLNTSVNEDELTALTDDYLRSQMVAGTILTRQAELFEADDAVTATLHYSCLEMIGKKSDKEILQIYEQTNR